MTRLSHRDRSRLMVVAAALLWSTSGFCAMAPWFDDWPMETRGATLTFWRAVFAAMTVLPFVRRPTFRLAMIPMSLSFVAMTDCFLVAMVRGSETTTIWLQYVGPAWVAIAGLAGLGDRPRRSDWVMVGLSLLGISVIVSMESRVAGQSLATGPVGLALFFGLMYAVVLLSIRHLRGVDAAWIGLVNPRLAGSSGLPVTPLVDADGGRSDCCGVCVVVRAGPAGETDRTDPQSSRPRMIIEGATWSVLYDRPLFCYSQRRFCTRPWNRPAR